MNITSEQISIITSIFTTIIGTCTTLIGIVFAVYAITMQIRKPTRINKLEFRKERAIMLLTLFNLLIPIIISLFFLTSFPFQLEKISDNGLINEDENIVYFWSICIMASFFTSIILSIFLKKTYKIVNLLEWTIFIFSLLLLLINIFLLGFNSISLNTLWIYMIVVLSLTLLQIWSYLETSSSNLIEQSIKDNLSINEEVKTF